MKKIVYLLALPLIMFSCSKEDADANKASATNPELSIISSSGDCRQLDLSIPEGCKEGCVDCSSTTAIVTSDNIRGIDDLAENGNSGDISSYFSGSEWQELFPDFMDEFWADVYNAIIDGECESIEKHVLESTTVFVFKNFAGNVMFAKPFVINE
jgi:hypothetical protein